MVSRIDLETLIVVEHHPFAFVSLFLSKQAAFERSFCCRVHSKEETGNFHLGSFPFSQLRMRIILFISLYHGSKIRLSESRTFDCKIDFKKVGASMLTALPLDTHRPFRHLKQTRKVASADSSFPHRFMSPQADQLLTHWAGLHLMQNFPLNNITGLPYPPIRDILPA